MNTKREDKQAESRPERVPLHMRNIQTVDNKDPAFVYCWQSDRDEGTMLIAFEQAGYEYVLDKTKVGDSSVYDGRSVARGHAVTHNGGRGDTMYLMRIKREWWEADRAAEQKIVNEREATMRRGSSAFTGSYGSMKSEHSFKF